MLRVFPFALAALVAAASCSSSTDGSSVDSCDNACSSPSDGANAACASTIGTGFWGFTRTASGCSGSNICWGDAGPTCASANLEFDSEDGGVFQVTSTANGVFHLALPAGNYQACCTSKSAVTPTCRSISLADRQKRHVDEESDTYGPCFFDVF